MKAIQHRLVPEGILNSLFVGLKVLGEGFSLYSWSCIKSLGFNTMIVKNMVDITSSSLFFHKCLTIPVFI